LPLCLVKLEKHTCMFQYLYPYINTPSMPQVRLAASSLILEPIANTSICLDALCHNKNSSPAFVVLNGTEIYSSRRCFGRCHGVRGGSLFIVNVRGRFRFFRASFFQNRLVFHFVCQVLIHRAVFDRLLQAGKHRYERAVQGGKRCPGPFLSFFLFLPEFYISQITEFHMFRLAEVEVAAVYPRIQEVIKNRGYQGAPSMPQVRLAASSLILEPIANTSICLDALCHNKNSSPAFVVLNGTEIYSSRRCLGRCHGVRGGSLFIVNVRGRFRFFRASFFQNHLVFHFVCQVLIHRAVFDVIILLDHRCHIQACPYDTLSAFFILYQNKLTINNEGHT
ncbi:hypothetical protein T10_916, partial [Trichinella papuae]